MTTLETKVYRFNELSETAKQKAINHFYDINLDYEWWEFIYEDARKIGLKITGFDLDRNRHCKGHFTLAANEVSDNIFREHGSIFETYKTAQKFMEQWQPIFNDYLNETSENYESYELEKQMIELEDEFLALILEDYASILQEEYDYKTSSEAIIETILANEYWFTEDGELV